jgi:hypothetical protein
VRPQLRSCRHRYRATPSQAPAGSHRSSPLGSTSCRATAAPSRSARCWQYNECNYPPPGPQAWPGTYGKAVFNVEYKLAASKFCPQANSVSYNFNSILKNVNLYDVPYTPCR